MERSELRTWLNSSDVEERSQLTGWPSAKTADLWRRFREGITQQSEGRWLKRIQSAKIDLAAHDHAMFRIRHADNGIAKLLTSDFREVTQLVGVLKQPIPGIQYCRSTPDGQLKIVTIGPS